MKDMKSIKLGLAMSALLGAGLASGTSLEQIGVDQMTQESAVVVVGDVAGQSGTQINGGIYTVISVNVSDVLKGTAGSSVDVLVPGGIAQTGSVAVAETSASAPMLLPGTEVVLFLDAANAQNQHQITGYSQGQLSVIDDGAQKMVHVAELANPVTLETFKDRVRNAAAGQ